MVTKINSNLYQADLLGEAFNKADLLSRLERDNLFSVLKNVATYLIIRGTHDDFGNKYKFIQAVYLNGDKINLKDI